MDSIEEQLRTVLADAPRTPVGSPYADRIRSSARRRRRRNTVLAIGVLTVVAAVMVGLVGSHPRGGVATPASPRPSAHTITATVPWRDLPVAEYPALTWSPRPDAPPCRAVDLAGSGGVGVNGHGGTSFNMPHFRNTGSSRCTLSGRPTLLGRDAHGATATIPVNTSTEWSPAPDQIPATIDPGEKAQIRIETYGGCLDGRAETRYRAVRLRLPAGRGELSLTAGHWINTTCGVGLTVWHRPTAVYTGIERLDALTVTIEAPARVQPGSTLDFVVTLHNGTAQDIPLNPCPNYRMGLFYASLDDEVELRNRHGVNVAPATHQLNCQVPTVPAGGQVRFVMRFDVPDSDKLIGEATVFWYIEPNRYATNASGRADLTISP